MFELPVTTKRLILRPFRSDDAPRVQELYGTWEVSNMLLGDAYPCPEGAAARWIALHPEMRESGKHYPLALELGGLCCGYLGLRPRDTGISIGYWLGFPYWGRGLMTEAVSTIVDLVFDSFDHDRLVAAHHADNAASAHILAKLGFVPIGKTVEYSLSRRANVDSIERALTRDDWAAKQV